MRGASIALVLLALLPGGATAQSTSPSAEDAPHLGALDGTGLSPTTLGGSAPFNSTLTVGNLSANLSSQFWGSTVNNEVRMFRGESNAVNATPARVLVWPGAMAGEDYNPLTNTHYDTYSGLPTKANTNESQFVEMCRSIHCAAIIQVPAEINNASFAEAIVNYTEVNLSFVPAYWMIGNEPELWYHWKVPWKNWPTQYTTGPTPTQFGNEVLTYVKAIRAVDNTTPILGLPASGCTCGSYPFDQWISGVLKVTGNKIQAVAFHEYPAGWLGTGDGSLLAFYQTIQSAANIPTRMVAARAAVQSACATCNVSVFISELGAALSWSAYGPYAIGFSGALSLASQITQAMDVNLSNVDLFATELATTNSWFDPTGHARPDYTLYTGILDHLGTEAFPVTLSGLGQSLYGIATVAPHDQGRQDLLVVNDNITKSVRFSPQFAGPAGSASVEAWSWNGSIHITKANNTDWVEPFTPTPIPQAFAGGLPGNYTLPPQSMVLFEAYPSGGTFVRVAESGVPSPTAWYARVGAGFYTTTADNLSLLLPTGQYSVGSVGIPLPLGGKEYVPNEQLGPYVPSPVEVSGAYTNFTIAFSDQWRINAFAAPAVGGTVTPGVAWWNASEPLHLTAAPALGYAFAGWSGWGPGSYNGTNRSITIVPMGRVVEKARFAVGTEVILWETGLPAGTPWSVTVRGISTNSSSNLLTVYELSGTYGFSVSPIPGFRSLPENGSFTVAGWGQSVLVQFIRLRPAPPQFNVSFVVSGLPWSTPVSITVRGAVQTTLAGDPLSTPRFSLINGSYGYDVGYVPGYHPDVPEKTFIVTGSALTIAVPFVPTLYPVTWEVSGTRAGLNWSLVLNGQPSAATSAWWSAALPNGSYAYAIELPANFTATPRTGVVNVTGAAQIMSITFSLVMFSLRFESTGLPGTEPWAVRFGNLTQGAWAGASTFLAANGTYTFDIHAPAGFYANPSHGSVTVAGSLPPMEIQFHPSSVHPSAALVAALTSGALMTALWIGLFVGVGYVTFRTLRGRKG